MFNKEINMKLKDTDYQLRHREPKYQGEVTGRLRGGLPVSFSFERSSQYHARQTNIMGKALSITVAIIIAIIAIVVYLTIPGIPEPPSVDRDNWFGKGDKRQQDETIKSFQISVSQQTLDDLKHRLQNTRFVETIENTHWEYGTNSEYLQQLVHHWINNYDWKTQEKLLNSFPNFQTNIDGLRVHFWHVKPQVKAGQVLVPIMFIHGWPGSFFEFYKVVQLLSKESVDGKFAFEIVCPSIPGFGFSEAAHKSGMNQLATGVMFSKLMARLGHKSFYVQGGDWGAGISRGMAILNKRHIKGIHLNMFPVISPPHGLWSYLVGYFTLPPLEHKKVFPLQKFFFDFLRETGYLHIQATRPDSVGVGMSNSPAGLAAYVIEKFHVASGCKLNELSVCLDSCFTKDQLITNLMIYWVTNSMTTAMRYYKENVANDDTWSIASIPIDVPSGLAEFPHEISVPPKSWVLPFFPNNVQYTVMPKGGHFAAFEQPQLFTKDIVQFVEKVEAMTDKVD